MRETLARGLECDVKTAVLDLVRAAAAPQHSVEHHPVVRDMESHLIEYADCFGGYVSVPLAEAEIDVRLLSPVRPVFEEIRAQSLASYLLGAEASHICEDHIGLLIRLNGLGGIISAYISYRVSDAVSCEHACSDIAGPSVAAGAEKPYFLALLEPVAYLVHKIMQHIDRQHISVHYRIIEDLAAETRIPYASVKISERNKNVRPVTHHFPRICNASENKSRYYFTHLTVSAHCFTASSYLSRSFFASHGFFFTPIPSSYMSISSSKAYLLPASAASVR